MVEKMIPETEVAITFNFLFLHIILEGFGASISS